jgi:hypothetical protein
MSTDSILVEKGSWGFTNDGKNLLIDAFSPATSFSISIRTGLGLFYFVARGAVNGCANNGNQFYTFLSLHQYVYHAFY